MRLSLQALAGFIALSIAFSGPASAEEKRGASAPGFLNEISRMDCGTYILCGRPNNSNKALTDKSKSAAIQRRRDANRALVIELNFFGFEAGAADGVISKQARQAISEFQAALGMPETGRLRRHERAFLKSSYDRAQKDSDSPTLATLVQYYDQANYAAPDDATQQDAADTCDAASVTDFHLSSGIIGVALQIDLLSGAEVEPKLAAQLTELCDLGRDMIRAGHELEVIYGLANQYTTDGPYRARMDYCQPVRGGMAGLIGRLDDVPPDAILTEATDLARRFGVDDPEIGRRIGTMCMGLGYRDRDARMALGGALLMLGSEGRVPAAEVIAAHLLHGFGTPKATAFAMDWTELAVTALEAEVVAGHPVPRADHRVALMRDLLETHQTDAAGASPSDTPPPQTATGTSDTDTD